MNTQPLINLGAKAYSNKHSKQVAVPLDAIAGVGSYEPDWNNHWCEGEEEYGVVFIKEEYHATHGEQFFTMKAFTYCVQDINAQIAEFENKCKGGESPYCETLII